MGNVLMVAQQDGVVYSLARNFMAGHAIAKVCAPFKADSMTAIRETLGHGDTLYIIGHGNTRKLGGYSPAEMATLLAKAGMPSGVAVELVACNSGSSGAPYALELKIQLVQNKILPNGVSGGTGYMSVKSDGTTTVRKPDVPKGPGAHKPSTAKGMTYATTTTFNI